MNIILYGLILLFVTYIMSGVVSISFFYIYLLIINPDQEVANKVNERMKRFFRHMWAILFILSITHVMLFEIFK